MQLFSNRKTSRSRDELLGQLRHSLTACRHVVLSAASKQVQTRAREGNTCGFLLFVSRWNYTAIMMTHMDDEL